MPNKNLSAAQRDAIFRKLGAWIDILGRAEAGLKFFEGVSTKIFEQFEQQKKLSNWVLEGVVLHTNTASGAILYGKLTAASPNSSVQLYKDDGLTQLVASGTGASGTTITLNEQNDSGITGTVDLASGGAALANDSDIELLVCQDALVRINDTFSETDENTQHAKIEIRNDLKDDKADDARTIYTNLKSQFEAIFVEDWLMDHLGAPTEIRDADLHDYDYTITDGAVAISGESGKLGWLKDIMNDNTTQITVQKTIPTSGTVSADPDNTGSGVLTVSALAEQVLPGTIHLRCNGETIGSETFTVENVLDEPLPNGTKIIEADNDLTIKKSFQDGPTGVTLLLSRATPSESGDTDDVLSNYTAISGETDANTDDGKVSFKVTRQAGPADAWKIELFSDDGLDAADELGEVTTASGAGNITLSISGQGFSITFAFHRTNAATAMPAIGDTYGPVTLDLKVFKIGDEITVDVNNPFSGKFQRFTAREYQVSLNSSGSPNVDDNFARIYPVLQSGD